MHRRLHSEEALVSLIRPETPLELSLLQSPAFCQGLLWGEPRFGHPEGSVASHVREVLDNINRITGLDRESRNRLRLVALSHDAFKYAEDRSHPRDWSKHHGVLARRFMESYTQDRMVLDVVEWHDDAYYCWLAQRHPASRRSIEHLLERIDYCLQLYYLFFKCDTQTGDKTQAPLRWFEQQVNGIQKVVIKPFWPWEK